MDSENYMGQKYRRIHFDRGKFDQMDKLSPLFKKI